MNIWASDKEPFEGYLICELLGHRRLVGYAREVEIAGAGFIRVDSLDENGEPAKTTLVNPASVYAITPITEEVAKRMARASSIAALPVARDWEDDEDERDEERRDPFDDR